MEMEIRHMIGADGVLVAIPIRRRFKLIGSGRLLPCSHRIALKPHQLLQKRSQLFPTKNKASRKTRSEIEAIRIKRKRHLRQKRREKNEREKLRTAQLEKENDTRLLNEFAKFAVLFLAVIISLLVDYLVR